MFARNILITAVATVSLGFAGTAMAQFDDTPFNGIAPSASNNQRGGGFKPADPRPYPGAPVRNYNTNPLTAEGAKTAQYQAEQRDAAASENRMNNTFPQYDTDRTTYIDRSAVTASDRMEPTPVVVQQPWVERSDAQEAVIASDGVDNRFLKPADPAVVMPDTKSNAGMDRTLAQDNVIRNSGQGIRDYSIDHDELAYRDVSNHPIDSLNDPAFKGPVVAESTWDSNARPASEVITPDAYVAPAVPSDTTYTPAPMAPEPLILNTGENHQPAVWKGERALGVKENIGNPLPEKTVFGKVGDVPAEVPTNRLPRP